MKKALRVIALVLAGLFMVYAILVTQPRKSNYSLDNPMRKQVEYVKNLADIVNGECKGRTSEDEIFLVSIEGMPIQDVAWAYECYHQAKKKGIGTMLNLWEEPVAF